MNHCPTCTCERLVENRPIMHQDYGCAVDVPATAVEGTFPPAAVSVEATPLEGVMAPPRTSFLWLPADEHPGGVRWRNITTNLREPPAPEAPPPTFSEADGAPVEGESTYNVTVDDHPFLPLPEGLEPERF